MLAAQAGKLIELFRIRSPTEAKKKLKRRIKRMREKEGGKEGGKGGKSFSTTTSFSAWDDSLTPLGTVANISTLDSDNSDPLGALLSPQELCLSDELETHGVIRATQKIRGCVFHPLGSVLTPPTPPPYAIL